MLAFIKCTKTSSVRRLMIYEAFTVLVQYSSWQLAKPLIMWCVSCTSHGADLLSLIIFMSTATGPKQSLEIFKFKLRWWGHGYLTWLSWTDFYGLWLSQNVTPPAMSHLTCLLHEWSLSELIIPSWINLDVHRCSTYKKASVCAFILIKDEGSDVKQIRWRWPFGTHHSFHHPYFRYSLSKALQKAALRTNI